MATVETRVPDVVDALVTAARTALPTWQVMDGPRAAEDPSRDVCMIGVGNDENADPYSTSRDGFDLGNRARETLTVRCQMSTWQGDVALSALRHRLGDALKALADAFQSSPSLSGTCALVRIGSARWYHLEGPDGAGAGVHFDVVALAWL